MLALIRFLELLVLEDHVLLFRRRCLQSLNLLLVVIRHFRLILYVFADQLTDIDAMHAWIHLRERLNHLVTTQKSVLHHELLGSALTVTRTEFVIIHFFLKFDLREVLVLPVFDELLLRKVQCEKILLDLGARLDELAQVDVWLDAAHDDHIDDQ